ncbi:transposase [Sporosarcina gallistercoris]|uniref:transposase n=1 Tax=Sporosarcina gallistercoris TaxID=2762245 RepID=UPI001CD8EAC1|nr:transposase [Sporosarcina gallistercoris]
MADGKYTMYVSVAHQQININKYDSPYEYEVNIPKEYIEIFHHLFDQTNELEFFNFLRAHLPYVPYHYDRDNHKVDLRLYKMYALIHEFTDDESRAVIERMPFFQQQVVTHKGAGNM